MDTHLRSDDPHQVVLSHWAYTLLGDTIVLSTRGEHPPSDPDFAHWLARLRHNDFSRIVIDSLGGEPNSAQRRELANYWKESNRTLPRVAMLTNSLSSRAAITAVNWLLQDAHIRAFALGDVEAAASWLGDNVHAVELAGCIAALRAALFHRGAVSLRPRKAR